MLEKLESRLRNLERTSIAYSGGIDSRFLLYVANKVLKKEDVLAVIANGNMIAEEDYNEAICFLKENNFEYIEVSYKPLEIPQFRENIKDRCYYCKKNFMYKIKKISKDKGFDNVLDGKNADDLNEYRPGNKAAEEIGIISPLAEIGFSKENIRRQAKKLGIKGWDKPSNSCLATRFPYNTILTKEALEKVQAGELIIKNLGINKVRLRVHGEIARIEVEKENFEMIIKNEHVIEKIKDLGFKFVTLDLLGLKSGSFD